MKYQDRVERLRAPLLEGYGGQQTRDWQHANRTPNIPAAVQPEATVEDTDRRQTTTSRWRIFLPPTVSWLATDRASWNSLDLEVDGEVQVWRYRGRDHHLEAVLKLVSEG